MNSPLKDRFSFANMPEQELRRFSCDMEQFAFARMSELCEGDGRGSRIVEVSNGSGMSFTIAPDRGMDIVEASFKGVPLAFRTPSGHVNAAKFDDGRFGWLRAWSGGLMTTCGLRHVGRPEEELSSPIDRQRGLHGRISRQAASSLAISQKWQDGRYVIAVSGVLREAMMFGENLRLHRTISTALGDNSILVEDRVENLALEPDAIRILYHCNFGFPLVAPGTRIAIEKLQSTEPRDDDAAKGLDSWNVMPEPQRGYKEQCFLHRVAHSADGWGRATLENDSLRLCASVSFNTESLPNVIQWKMAGAGCYVIGLEPSNTLMSGHAKDAATGAARLLEPGESASFCVRLAFGEMP